MSLIPPNSADAEAIFERYASDGEVTRYLSWPRHQTIADTRAFLSFSAAEWERWPAGPYLIRQRADGQLLGSTGLSFETSDQAMTGYLLAKDAWGKGYATEALQAIILIAGTMKLKRIYALCHPEHRASLRVLEKCGFKRDTTSTRQTQFPNLAPGILQDALYYELILA